MTADTAVLPRRSRTRGRQAASLLATVTIAFATVAAAPAVHAQSPDNFVAVLSGAAEVPANDSAGRGQTKLKLDADETALDYRLIVANIENVTQAHVHCGAAGVNGPVVAFLYPDGPPAELIPGRSDGVLAEGTITPDDVIARPDSPACPGGVAGFGDLLDKIRSGEAYVNVHTSQFPGGEIRGQLR